MGGFFSKAKPQLVSEENFSKFRSALAEAARGKEFNELITKGSRFYDLISSHAEFYIDTMHDCRKLKRLLVVVRMMRKN